MTAALDHPKTAHLYEGCPACGSGDAKIVTIMNPVAVGAPFPTVEVELRVTDCPACEEQYTAPGDRDAATLRAFRVHQAALMGEPVENRCMAADGPVTPTCDEITDDDLREIWALARTHTDGDEG